LNVTLLPTAAEDVTLAKINSIAFVLVDGALIVKMAPAEVPPPGVGFTTVTLDVPTAATSGAVTSAVTVEEDTKVVVRSEPFHCTVELPTKFVPVTVSVKPECPAIVEVGLIEVSVGTGFAVAVTVNVWLLEVPPPGAGVTTTTGNVPVAATSAAGIVAASCVDEANVVVASTPLKLTTESATKFVPFTVSVKSGPPAAVEVGVKEVVVGTGFVVAVTVNVCALEVPPPGVGFVTVIDAVPVASTSEARIVASSVELEMNVVERDEPFQLTLEPDTKLVPVTVSVKSGLPAAVEVGLREVVVGTGFRIVNVCALEVPPPGGKFVTVTGKVPAVVMSLAGTVAVTSFAETNVVLAAIPLKLTTELEMKFVPVTVIVKPALPAIVEVGLMEAVDGTGLVGVVIVNVCAPEVPPPGVGFVTVTEAVPVASTSEARIVASSVELEMNVVERDEPFQLTLEPDTKLVPVTVSVKSELPAGVEVGEIAVVVGTKL
jgi:hypothetical protein